MSASQLYVQFTRQYISRLTANLSNSPSSDSLTRELIRRLTLSIS
jgi:hypothetical protein